METRYKYFVSSTNERCSIMGNVSVKAYSDMKFIRNISVDEIFEKSESDINQGPIVFWIVWMLFTFSLVGAFCSMENKWLY